MKAVEEKTQMKLKIIEYRQKNLERDIKEYLNTATQKTEATGKDR